MWLACVHHASAMGPPCVCHMYVPALCQPPVHHVSALCPPLSGGFCCVCPSCVRHVYATCPPYVRLCMVLCVGLPLSAVLRRAPAFVRLCPLFVSSLSTFVPIIVFSSTGKRLAAISLGLASGLCPFLACCGTGPWHHQTTFCLTIAQPTAFILHAR